MITVREALTTSVGLKAAYRKVCSGARSALCRVSPKMLARLNYRSAWGRWPDLDIPTTFDEKLLWLNFHWPHPLKTECGDKYTMRGYVERKGLGQLLPRLHGVYESIEQIDFAALPERFVLKCTHACKCNIFCRDKAELDIASARRLLARWLRLNFSMVGGELHYAAMKPRVICEEFLDDGNGPLPTDYKVFCFNGKPRWILCCFDRVPNGLAKRVVVDLGWKRSTILRNTAQVSIPPRPIALADILCASEKLCAPFPFVRIDFYCVGRRAVLGEMTFTPNACINKDYAQYEMGRLLRLPQPWVEPRDGRALHRITCEIDRHPHRSGPPVALR